MIRVLFIPRWYPNRYDPMPGLFIQRQAEALAVHCQVAVIYVQPDPVCPNKYETEFSVENGVRVLRIYFRSHRDGASVLNRTVDAWKYYRAYRRAFRSIRGFDPEIIHAHVLTRTGFIGWRISGAAKIPLVISEHWSRYFRENGTYKGWLRKCLTRLVVREAGAVIAVSSKLRDAMRGCGLDHSRFAVIPNVVEYPQAIDWTFQNKEGPVTMVHISCFDDRSKNISGFLRSLKALSEIRQDFTCLLVGRGPDFDDMKEYAGFLRIPDSCIEFTGMKTGEELEEIMKKADFSVLSSRYETFGTVVIESLAWGVPVVATSTGIAPEVVNEQNGILVPPGDEAAMTGALDRMIDQCRKFDPGAIRISLSDRYTGEKVGLQIMDLYRELLAGK